MLVLSIMTRATEAHHIRGIEQAWAIIKHYSASMFSSVYIQTIAAHKRSLCHLFFSAALFAWNTFARINVFIYVYGNAAELYGTVNKQTLRYLHNIHHAVCQGPSEGHLNNYESLEAPP